MITQTSSILAMLLDRLDGVHRQGAGYAALCPAHDDQIPSLSISIGREGTLLIHCHAGCSPDAVLAACDLSLADLFDEEHRHDTLHDRHEARSRQLSPDRAPIHRPYSQTTRRKRSIAAASSWLRVASYPYLDESGGFLYGVDRLERSVVYTDHPTRSDYQKRFVQWHRDADGNRVNSVKGCRMVLYMLPDVVSAVRIGTPIFIVEGEKDADSANLHFRHEIGEYVATTAPGGVGKWRQEYTDVLRGATVFLCGDADEPGQEHVEELGLHFQHHVHELRIIDIHALLAGGFRGNQ
ncbi:MAG: hypothetical protein ABIR47_16990 [Candidatus Kapaibacterium sp.]